MDPIPTTRLRVVVPAYETQDHVEWGQTDRCSTKQSGDGPWSPSRYGQIGENGETMVAREIRKEGSKFVAAAIFRDLRVRERGTDFAEHLDIRVGKAREVCQEESSSVHLDGGTRGLRGSRVSECLGAVGVPVGIGGLMDYDIHSELARPRWFPGVPRVEDARIV